MNISTQIDNRRLLVFVFLLPATIGREHGLVKELERLLTLQRSLGSLLLLLVLNGLGKRVDFGLSRISGIETGKTATSQFFHLLPASISILTTYPTLPSTLVKTLLDDVGRLAGELHARQLEAKRLDGATKQFDTRSRNSSFENNIENK
jgi:hypothetical protein